MSNVLVNVFKVPDIRKKVLFTLFILIIYRLGAHIPIPGINVAALQYFFEQSANSMAGGLLNFFDLFSGGALKQFTIFALGVMPYISASIIFQLLQIIVPQIEKMSKEGPEGRKKISTYTKYLTVFLCVFQSTAIASWLKSFQQVGDYGYIVDPDSGFMFFFMTAITITTGTMVLMWLGELINDRGIGNGISLIIFAGIVVRFPEALITTTQKIVSRSEPIVFIMLAGVFFVVIAASILLTLGRRNIPLQFGKRQLGGSSIGGQSLPVPINAGNVIPIIFAAALMQFPSQIANFIPGNSPVLNKIQFFLSNGHPVYLVCYTTLILFFTLFYSAIVFNTEEVSKNLQKNQGFIPGVRPGNETAEYLSGVLNRVTLTGAIILAAIAIAPDLMLKMWPDEISPTMAYMFGGTSLLIVVGVALDTLKQLESQLKMRHYDGFFKKGKMKGRR